MTINSEGVISGSGSNEPPAYTLLLRPSAVAVRLGISRGQVYRLISLGILPGVRLGDKTIRVPAREFEVFVEDLSRDHSVVRPITQEDRKPGE